MSKSYADIWMGYFKQGDDLSHHLKDEKSVVDALRSYSSQLQSASELAGAIATFLDGVDGIDINDIEIDADTHHIGICGPDVVINDLIKRGLAQKSDLDDE